MVKSGRVSEGWPESIWIKATKRKIQATPIYFVVCQVLKSNLFNPIYWFTPFPIVQAFLLNVQSLFEMDRFILKRF